MRAPRALALLARGHWFLCDFFKKCVAWLKFHYSPAAAGATSGAAAAGSGHAAAGRVVRHASGTLSAAGRSLAIRVTRGVLVLAWAALVLLYQLTAGVLEVVADSTGLSALLAAAAAGPGPTRARLPWWWLRTGPRCRRCPGFASAPAAPPRFAAAAHSSCAASSQSSRPRHSSTAA